MFALSYETFVRGAFSLDSATLIDRSQDPAMVAEADYWRIGDLSKVKAGAAYAIVAYSNHILEKCGLEDDDDSLHSNLEDSLSRTFNTSTLEELQSIIEEVRRYVNQYVVFPWNIE